MAEIIRKLKVRSGTAAAWTTANPTLSAGEIGYETDTNKFKIGDGATEWSDIEDYFETAGDIEPAIAAGTTAQYWRGDKSWRDFATDVRAAVLTGLSTASNTVVTAAHTVLQAIGFLQKQITDLGTSKADLASPALTGNPTAPTQSAGNNSTRIATTAFVQDELANRIIQAAGSPVAVNAVWSGSQAQYDAIGAPDANTLYFIV